METKWEKGEQGLAVCGSQKAHLHIKTQGGGKVMGHTPNKYEALKACVSWELKTFIFLMHL